jgi:hypothetical protein
MDPQFAARSGVGGTLLRLPDFFLVGNAKGGTTALYQMLRQHPDIYMPENKEPWFFASELHERTPPRPGGTPKTLDEYAALFDDATPEQLVGEASVLYLWSRTAAQAIFEQCPQAKIIAIFREPASFLHSLHMQFTQDYVETEADFRAALALEDERRAGRQIPPRTYWPKALFYSDHVRYVDQLERFSELFGPANVLPLIYDDFRADNEATVQEVLGFLGVDADVSVSASEVNGSVRVRSQRAHDLIHAVTVGRGPVSTALKDAVKTVTPERWRRQALQAAKDRFVFGDPVVPDQELMLSLRRRFKGEVEALSEYLDRDLVGLWGYDSID